MIEFYFLLLFLFSKENGLEWNFAYFLKLEMKLNESEREIEAKVE